MTDRDHYTLEAHVADSGRLAERTALRLLAALAAEAETLFGSGGLRGGLAAADVEMDGEPELARIRETLSASDPRRRAAIPPECAEAGEGTTTERAVVFALGLVAFHALSGSAAFRADGESVKRAAPVYDLRAHRVSEPTIELIRQATARDPGSRPKRIKKLRKAAEKILKRTRWDGDRPARRERRPSIALPVMAIGTVAATVALFWFRVGPFQAERVTEGFSRLFSGPAEPEAPGGAEPSAPNAAPIEPQTPAVAETASAPPGETAPENDSSEPPRRENPDDFLFPRQPSAADTALYKEAMDGLAAARAIIETSAFDTGDKKFDALREAMKRLEASRGLLEKYAETHPEKRPTVERRMVEINQELMFCRKILPTKE